MRSTALPTAPWRIRSVDTRTSPLGACASSAMQGSASARTICASCASSASSRATIRPPRPTPKGSTPRSRRRRGWRSFRASVSARSFSCCSLRPARSRPRARCRRRGSSRRSSVFHGDVDRLARLVAVETSLGREPDAAAAARRLGGRRRARDPAVEAETFHRRDGAARYRRTYATPPSRPRAPSARRRASSTATAPRPSSTAR